MFVSSCRNCGATPEIIESDEPRYPYVIKHKDSDLCCPEFKLVAYHISRAKCAERWNEFNQNNKAP